jgi:hypothetical protein
MLAATRSGVMPASWLRESKPHHIQFLHDLEREPGVGARIKRERRQIMAVIVRDLGDAITDVPGNGLSLAENLARHSVERVIVHAYEGTAQQVDAVEHEAARNARLAAAEIAFGFADANAPYVPAQRKEMAHALSNALQYRQVEIDDVPTRQHIRIKASNPVTECLQGRIFMGAANRLIGHCAVAAVDDEYFIDAGRIHRDRQQTRRCAVGFDVERQHARLDFHIGRPQGRIVEYPGDARSRGRLAFDLTASFDAALDQIAHREAHVGLECIDAGIVKTIPHTRDLGRGVHFKQGYLGAVEGPLAGRLRRRYPQDPCAFSVGGSNEEMGPLAVVPDQKRSARLQSPIEVDDGNALPIGPGYDPVTGLKNETAELDHAAILRARGLSE